MSDPTTATGPLKGAGSVADRSSYAHSPVPTSAAERHKPRQLLKFYPEPPHQLVGPNSRRIPASDTGACQKRAVARDLIPMDFYDETFEIDEDTPDGPDQPDFRATVQRSGAIRLVHWGPWLQSTGPAYTLMTARDRAGVAIADLRVSRDDEGMASEVIVEFHSGGGDTHRAALIDWAHAVGYRRVWFDGELVDLEQTAGGPVTTRCTGCGQQFVDGRTGHFWHHVRASGVFPTACSLCGSDLPQWTRTRPTDAGGANRNALARAGPAHAARRAHRR